MCGYRIRRDQGSHSAAALPSVWAADRESARETALVLGPGREFAFIAIGAAIPANVVPAAAGATAMVAATLPMFRMPRLVRLAKRGARVRHPDDPALLSLIPQPDGRPARVIIVGYGRVGELVGQMLARHDVPHLAVDSDANLSHANDTMANLSFMVMPLGSTLAKAAPLGEKHRPQLRKTLQGIELARRHSVTVSPIIEMPG